MGHSMASSHDKELLKSKGGAGYVAMLGAEPVKFLLGLPKANGYGSASTAAQVAADWDGRDKVVIITGASTGLGLESAKTLAARGAEVILAVRNPAKAEHAVAAVRAAATATAAAGKAAAITSMALDLASLASVRAFADAFRASGRKLHVLMCNAGVMATPFELSEDGVELQFATNHLGHFLLTQLLLDNMLATAEAEGSEGRIVMLTSYSHVYAPKDLAMAAHAFDIQQLSSRKGYNAARAYGCSKLANILFARQLAQQLEGRPVVVAACHPGVITGTDLTRHVCPCFPGRKLITKLLMAPMAKNIQQGAATQVYLSTAPKGEVHSGENYKDCNLEVSSVASHSRALAQQLWDVSTHLCAPFLHEDDAAQSTATVSVTTPVNGQRREECRRAAKKHA